MPGIGEIKWPPVSVCHQVSITGHLFLPTTDEYQFHASGLIGSPTVPKILRSLNHIFQYKNYPLSLKILGQLVLCKNIYFVFITNFPKARIIWIIRTPSNNNVLQPFARGP